MLIADQCSYKLLNADQGTERAAYTIHCKTRAGYEINAMKDEKKGDYVITKDHVSQTLEVGGKNKNPKEADYVLRDNTDYPVGNAIPFWLMGLMCEYYSHHLKKLSPSHSSPPFKKEMNVQGDYFLSESRKIPIFPTPLSSAHSVNDITIHNDNIRVVALLHKNICYCFPIRS